MRVAKGDIVTQGNELIEASYKMTLNEKRVLLLGIAQINPLGPPGEALTFTITVDDWLGVYGEDIHPWQSMQRGAKGLLRRYVTFRKSVNEVVDISWFDIASYREGDGTIKVEFGRNISKYLTGNLDRFTAIPLLTLGQFHSIHTIRLYELLKQYKFTGLLKISVEEFRFSMACGYPQMCSLKNRVVEPALKEINDKTDIDVTFEQITSGHRGGAVTHFIFDFHPEMRNKKDCRQEYIPREDARHSGRSTKTRDRSLAEDMNDRSWAE